MRLGAHFFSVFAALELELLDGIGEIPPPPVETGARSATELLQSGMLRVDVDAKYPQAVSISQISDLARNFASSRWEILLNAHSSSTPFVTSDYPVSLERVQGRAMRVVAFRPDLAVRIWPNADIRDREPTIEDFRHRYLAPSKAEVRGVVRTIVRSAEDFIFSPQSSEGLKRLVSKHANFRVENIARRIPVNGGTKLHNSQHVVERTSG